MDKPNAEHVILWISSHPDLKMAQNIVTYINDLRTQLAAEIARREMAEGRQFEHRCDAQSWFDRAVKEGEVRSRAVERAEYLEQALQKSEAEKVELATLVMDGQTFIADFLEPDEIPISDKLYNQIEFDDIYNATLAKAKAIIERGK